MTPTKRTELRRIPSRGFRETEAIKQSLLPVNHLLFDIAWLKWKKLYLHGSAASRMWLELETSLPTCVTVTLVDGLALVHFAFDHSMN